VVVPAPCVWVLLWGGDLLDLLEDLDVGLRGGVAVLVLASDSSEDLQSGSNSKEGFRVATSAWFCYQIAGS
jgi:hypothetical protein